VFNQLLEQRFTPIPGQTQYQKFNKTPGPGHYQLTAPFKERQEGARLLGKIAPEPKNDKPGPTTYF
jgi:hypothetical protein